MAVLSNLRQDLWCLMQRAARVWAGLAAEFKPRV